ncbi:hypothetical protein [Streptomyces sp. Z26]|uniref:hypothetical protein n=1 Tax=Streptomyces TaxID=1883 RepID=UPI000EF15BFB|nr:hypothetical protein [Streptomyces sp. Z26]
MPLVAPLPVRVPDPDDVNSRIRALMSGPPDGGRSAEYRQLLALWSRVSAPPVARAASGPCGAAPGA